MRHNVLLCLCLALAGCIGSGQPREAPVSGGPPAVAAADSTVMHRLMGQDVLDQPLLPEPGNIWADVLPTTQPGPSAALPATSRTEHHPVVAAASSAGSPGPAVPAMAKAAPQVEPHLAVQLAALGSAQRAEAEWQRLRQHAPKLTDGHQPAISEAEVNGHQVWRLRTAGFADVAEAGAFCTDIRTAKSDCWVVPPTASPWALLAR